MRSSAARERGAVLVSALLVGLACGPPPAFRSAAPADLARLDPLCAPVATAFTATGHIRFTSSEGEIDGELELRMAPPDRAWIEIRSRALFGMLGNTVEVSLPGDGFLLVLDHRQERLERVPFDSTLAAAVCPRAGPELLLALVGGKTTCDLIHQARNPQVASGNAPQLRLDLAPAAGGGVLTLKMQGEDLVGLEWQVAAERRLSVRYDRYVPLGSARVPTRIVAQAPAAGVHAEIELRAVEPRSGFGPQAFEVGGGGNPVPRGGVHRG